MGFIHRSVVRILLMVAILGGLAIARPQTAAAASPTIWLLTTPSSPYYTVGGSSFTPGATVNVRFYAANGSVVWQGTATAAPSMVYQCLPWYCGMVPNPMQGGISLPTAFYTCFPGDGASVIAVDLSTGIQSNRIAIEYCPW